MDLLSKLQLLQRENGYLPKEKIAELAKAEGMSTAELIGSASFYEFFHFSPAEEKNNIEKMYPCRKAGILLSAPETYTWTALDKAKEDVDSAIQTLKEAGLVGRGGGGFPVWSKWLTVKETLADEKYVICNADEGEPGTGKDRVLLERNPKAVIEGMAICGAIVGSRKGILYLRGEYADLEKSLRETISSAPLNGFEIEIVVGHGAYVCGEETALIESVEGKRGEPRLKPPYPGVSGLWGKPTVVNNVETFACVPFIIEFGAENFRRWGTEDYPGTKLFTILGKVKNPGVYELEAGITVAQLLEAAGGESEKLQAVLVGGGSGTLVGLACLNMPMTPAECVKRGAVFGTASLRFIGEGEDLLSLVIDLCGFYEKESCGMCVPCRIGLRQLKGLLMKFRYNRAFPEDVEEIRELSEHIKMNSRCGLGPAAVTPVVSLLKNFPEVLK
ncbi:MAG: NADH-ubiquinone oxidoreductase-F iron-sulfur binding region domain-containing protein [Faecousia sp.]